jgi:4-amino-4-deoxy-L-arabinose transferase-like glycosyltransferase
VLYVAGLGGLPLRDWDEAIVAQVAREMAEAPAGSRAWLRPTLHGEPYVHKPPLLHWMIAGAFALGGVSEWTARLPGALFGAAGVPLLYGVARALPLSPGAGWLTAAIYLTLLPVVRHGRLAMLDAALVSLALLGLAGLLLARRHPGWAVGAGVAFAFACVTKGLAGLLFAALGLLVVALEGSLGQPAGARGRLRSRWLWIGMALPVVAVAGWYGLLWAQHGTGALRVAAVDQSLDRVLFPIEGHPGPPWYHLGEVAKFAWPWLLVLPAAAGGLWRQRRSPWARAVMIWGGGYLLAVSLTATKLPWYTYPLYAPLALVAGAFLGAVWDGTHRPAWRTWALVFGAAALLTGGAGAVMAGPDVQSWLGLPALGVDPRAGAALVAVAVGLAAAATLAGRRDRRFAAALVAGTWAGLLLFVVSDHWVWELREDFDVRPVAALVRQTVPPGATVYTTHPRARPSLAFYSGHRVVPAAPEAIIAMWAAASPPGYVLARSGDLFALAPALGGIGIAGRAGDWIVLAARSRAGGR